MKVLYAFILIGILFISACTTTGQVVKDVDTSECKEVAITYEENEPYIEEECSDVDFEHTLIYLTPTTYNAKDLRYERFAKLTNNEDKKGLFRVQVVYYEDDKEVGRSEDFIIYSIESERSRVIDLFWYTEESGEKELKLDMLEASQRNVCKDVVKYKKVTKIRNETTCSS